MRSKRLTIAPWKRVRCLESISRAAAACCWILSRLASRSRKGKYRSEVCRNPIRPSTSGSLMKKTGCTSAISGRKRTSRSHSSAPTGLPCQVNACWLRMRSSELRATESRGLTRPPSSTGRRLNRSRSNPRVLAAGRSAVAANATATIAAAQGISFGIRISCLQGGGLLPRGRPAQAEGEVQEQSARDQQAGRVGQQPSRVLDHLQDGERVVLAEARLVERLASVAEWLVHVDEDLARLSRRGTRDLHQAGEVLRDVGARIDVVLELLEGHRERQVFAVAPERERIGPPVVDEGLRCAENVGDQPGAVALGAGERLDEGGLAVRLVVPRARFGLGDVDLGPDAHGRERGRIVGPAPGEIGVLVEGVDLEEER